MDPELFEQLHIDGLISKEEHAQVIEREDDRLVSVRMELRILLYLGVIFLCTGLGIWVYKNIESIGHMVIIAGIGILSAASFAYCFRTGSHFSKQKVASTNVWFDYVLLLGSLLMISFVSYIQYQYHFFGTEWGLATFIPMCILFLLAYYFDHAGVLSLAITALGTWMGISMHPMNYIGMSRLGDYDLIWNGIILGSLLQLLQAISERFDLKRHFALVYKNFGVHVLFISMLAAMWEYNDYYLAWCLLIGAVAFYLYSEAMRSFSFYFVLVSLVYAYFALSYLVERLLSKAANNSLLEYGMLLYAIGSGIALVVLLIRLNKQLRNHDRI